MGQRSFGELGAELPRDQHADDGDDEGDGELPEIGSRLRLGQSEEQRLDAAGEHEEDREDRPRLDHDVEQLRLPGQETAVLGQEQVTGRRDGQELGDAFDDAEQDDGEPVGHRAVLERLGRWARQPVMSSPPSTPMTLPVIQ